MGQIKNLGLIILASVAVLVSFTVYTVTELERGVLLRLGQIVDGDLKPGIHFKIPGYHMVKKFDGRILTLDAEPKPYYTLEKKRVIVDSFIKWRIAEDGVEKYYTSTGGDERYAGRLLFEIINKMLKDEFAIRTIQEVVSGEREKIMSTLVESANNQSAELGVQIVDVRVKRIDLPIEVSQSVYQRMRAAREKIARDLRSQGAEEAEKIRADADRQRTIILADAYRDSEILRGEGDAKAAETYANAYNKDKEFYGFTRRMTAYQNSLKNKSDILVIEPDSDFFKNFNEVKPN